MKSTQKFEELDDETIAVISTTTYTKEEFKNLVFPLTARITTLLHPKVSLDKKELEHTPKDYSELPEDKDG